MPRGTRACSSNIARARGALDSKGLRGAVCIGYRGGLRGALTSDCMDRVNSPDCVWLGRGAVSGYKIAVGDLPPREGSA